MKSRSLWIAPVLAIAALAGLGFVASENSVVKAGDSCCPSTKAAPAATTQNVSYAEKSACGSPVAVSAEGASCGVKATAVSADAACGTKPTAVPAALRAAVAEWEQANAAFIQAVDSGASPAEVRQLSVKAGGAYAAVVRTAAESYKSGKGTASLASSGSSSNAGFATFVGGMAPWMAANCADKEGCDWSSKTSPASDGKDGQKACPYSQPAAAGVEVSSNR